MRSTLFRLCVACVLLLAFLPLTAWGKDAPRPNIIVMMSDDMGYSDIGSYGGEIDTPNLDRLAQNGLRYTQFYNTGRCCPTRASLLTGLYAHQAGIGQMMNDLGQPGYRGDLSFNAVTMAEVMQTAGYRTYMAGKWHVTKQLKPEGNKDNWPMQRGFDRFYGTITGAGSFFDPWTLTRDNIAITPENDPLYKPQTYYYTDAISDNAAMFIRDHQQGYKDRPFFMYVAYTAAHWPMHALPEDLAKYKGKFDAGYHAFREARFEKMKKLGLIKEGWELSPAPGKWEDVPASERAWELRCMEVYAAMVDRMDQGIGKIIAELEKAGQLDNTLILFFQDNGGCAEPYGRQPAKKDQRPQAREPYGPDELQTAMQPKHSRAGLPVLTGPDVMPGPADTYIGYGMNWANVSNTPLRLYKSRVHEGGIATPLIAHWPGGIKDASALRQRIGHLIDIMPTCIELAGASYPTAYRGHDILPLEGQSLVASFAKDEQPDRVLMWEHYGNRAIRQGQWKLVALKDKPWELYNLDADRSEMHDLSQEMPEKVNAMSEQWETHAHRTLIYPRPRDRNP